MTFRLVALISVVLLLSLASFGLLMSQHQDSVMREVARTASAVGQAALLEMHGSSATMFVSGPPTPERLMRLRGGESSMEVYSQQFEFVNSHGAAATEDRTVRHIIVAGTLEGGERVKTVERIRETETGPVIHEWVEQCEVEGTERNCDVTEGAVEARIAARELARFPAGNQFFIDATGVRVDADADGRLVLKIPKLTPTGEGENEGYGHGQVIDIQVQASGGEGAPDFMTALKEEIQLPIPVRDYEQLFDRMRSRSALLALGVFLVGTVLSAGLATRFTRPVRKLDAGIRRLSEGDLDAEVQIQGKDEIARLSRAFNDMTRKLRANRDRTRENVRREKLSALGRLAAGVAHDLRNPLHSIGLTLQHMSETARPEQAERAEEFDRSLEIIRGEIRRLDQLAGNFLRFAGSERLERERIDLAELLRETVRLVQKEAEWRKVEIELDVDASAPPVLADGEAIRSSVLNLVLNSFEAMPEGGRLTLTLGADSGEVLLEVADTGRGIEAEDRERVFEFAYTTREGGNGLGLAMVHHTVVEEHAGRVSLDSRPGEGTRVRIALPTGVPAAEAQA